MGNMGAGSAKTPQKVKTPDEPSSLAASRLGSASPASMATPSAMVPENSQSTTQALHTEYQSVVAKPDDSATLGDASNGLGKAAKPNTQQLDPPLTLLRTSRAAATLRRKTLSESAMTKYKDKAITMNSLLGMRVVKAGAVDVFGSDAYEKSSVFGIAFQY